MIAPVLEARFESHVAIDLTGIDDLAFTSRLTAVEGFFAELTKRGLKQSLVRSIVDLQAP